MPKVTNVYSTDQRRINRNRALADALLAQSQQGSQPDSSGLRVVPKYQVGAGIAQLATALAGGFAGRRADKQQAELDQRVEGENQSLLKDLYPDDPGAGSVVPDETGNLSTQSGGEGQRKREFLSRVLQGQDPQQVRQFLTQQSLARLQPQQEDEYTLGANEARFRGGQQIARGPAPAEKQSEFEQALAASGLTPEEQQYIRQQYVLKQSTHAPTAATQPTPTQLVTRPGPDGKQQDFAFDPRARQLTPVGEPYSKQAPLSPKDTSTAKQKLVQIQIARQQLQTAKDAFSKIKDSFSAGPGGGLIPTESGKLFDGAIDVIRGTITALTRVPGVGSMSNYETELDQTKLPARGQYEAVTELKLKELDRVINLLDAGYRDLLGGETDVGTPDAPPSSNSGLPAVKDDADFDRLPSGSEFIGPDGKRRRKP